MDGIGCVTTNSPTWFTTFSPRSLNAYTAAPSARAWISPAYTGRMEAPATNPVQTSVPPLPDATHKSFLTLSYSHSMHSGVTGEPARATPWSVDSLNLSLGTNPPFSSADTYVGLVPNSEAPE